jgi:hypothetical protein
MSVTAVSIIMPTYDRLEFLRPAVDSVLAQTFEDWDLIIADDGSSEPTRAYLRTLALRPRVKVIWLEHTGNPGAVRNAAIREAGGEYIAFMDSDDLWMPTKLERQMSAMRAHLDCRWSCTGSMLIDASGGFKPLGYEQRIRYRGAVLEHLLVHAMDIWTPAVVVERRLLAQVGGFNEELRLFEDYDLWLRLASQSEIHPIDEPLICVRRSHDRHYTAEDGAVSMAACRHKSLQSLRPFVMDSRLRSLVGRAHARSVLDLANLQATTDRLGAAKTVLSSLTWSWRYGQWWAGLPRTVLRLLAPRALIGLYRRARSAKGKSQMRPGLR